MPFKAARRPLTFGLPASTLAVGETRSGGLILALPPPKGQKAQTRNGETPELLPQQSARF